MLIFSGARIRMHGGRFGSARVQRAGAVGAQILIPPIAIAGDPGVDAPGDEVNSRHEQNPGHEMPARQGESNAGPGIRAREDASVAVHGHHPTHGFFAVHLREARRNVCLVQIEQFDAPVAIHAPHASRARAAQGAGAVVKDGQLREHFSILAG